MERHKLTALDFRQNDVMRSRVPALNYCYMYTGADTEKNFGGRLEKIRIITVRPVFKNLATRAYYLCLPQKKIKKNK
jgi:hypothetical protein